MAVAVNLETRLVPKEAINSSDPEKAAKAAADSLLPQHEIDTEKNKKKLHQVALNRIRCVMISLVVLYHSAEIFRDEAYTEYLVPGLTRSYMSVFSIVIGGSAWPMFIFFTLSGYAAYHSLRVRSVRDFLGDRSLRLLPPIFFGVLLLQPIRIYLFVHMAQLYGRDSAWADMLGFTSLWDFISSFYVECFHHCPSPSIVIGPFWYLMYLYVLCITGLPLFLLWKKVPPPSITARGLSTVLVRLMLLLLPLVVWAAEHLWIPISSRSFLQLFGAGKNFFSFFLFVLFGFFLAWCKEAHEILLGMSGFFAGVSVSLFSIFLVTDMDGVRRNGDYIKILLMDIFAVATFYAVWGVAHRVLPNLPKFLAVPFDYIADRAIAVYVLHKLLEACVLTALFYACGSSFLASYTIPRFALQFVMTYVTTLAVYEALFRYAYVKILVGMMRVSDLRKAPTPTPTPTATAKQRQVVPTDSSSAQ